MTDQSWLTQKRANAFLANSVGNNKDKKDGGVSIDIFLYIYIILDSVLTIPGHDASFFTLMIASDQPG